jgi:hypothetical protein
MSSNTERHFQRLKSDFNIFVKGWLISGLDKYTPAACFLQDFGLMPGLWLDYAVRIRHLFDAVRRTNNRKDCIYLQ